MFSSARIGAPAATSENGDLDGFAGRTTGDGSEPGRGHRLPHHSSPLLPSAAWSSIPRDVQRSRRIFPDCSRRSE
jgi:hypothetical protein